MSSTWFTLVELCCGSSWYPELEDLDRLSLTPRGPPLPPPQSHFTARKAELKRERGQFLVPLRVQGYLHRGGRPRWVGATKLSTSFKHIFKRILGIQAQTICLCSHVRVGVKYFRKESLNIPNRTAYSFIHILY